MLEGRLLLEASALVGAGGAFTHFILCLLRLSPQVRSSGEAALSFST